MADLSDNVQTDEEQARASAERPPARRYELSSPPPAGPVPPAPTNGDRERTLAGDQQSTSRQRAIPGYQPASIASQRPPMPEPRPLRRPNRQAAAASDDTPYLTRYRTDEPEARESIASRLAGWLAVLLAVVVVAGLASILIYQQVNDGRIYPGVHVLDLDLSGLTVKEAEAKLDARLAEFSSKPVTLAWGDRKWQPQLTEVGVAIDRDATLQTAYDVGRKGGMTDSLGGQWVALREGTVVPLIVNLDEAQIGKYLQVIGAQIEQPLKEGDVQLDTASGVVTTTIGQEGRSLDLYATVGAIKDALNNLAPATVNVAVTITPPVVSEAEAKRVTATLDTWLSSPVAARFEEKNYVLDRPTLAKLVGITRVLDRQLPGDHISLTLAQGPLDNFARNIVQDISRPAQNARFDWNGGGLTVISESVDGRSLDATQTAALVIAAINQPTAAGANERVAGLPVQVLAPAVSSKDIGALGIRELVGSGRSTFAGSSKERAQNIRVGAGYLNGAVVPPGATFSFLGAIGEISLERGYAEGYVIAAERTKKDVGGGLCQVSTTAFRAAFYSGVPIVERNQHSYRVNWYEADGSPVGFDAAVFDPGADMKFVNDSGNFLLVQAVVNGSELVVNFYGTRPPGLDVQLADARTGPQIAPPPDRYEVDPNLPPGSKKQVDYAHAGIDATIVRQITKDGQTTRDEFRSSYRPWPNIFLVASDVQVR